MNPNTMLCRTKEFVEDDDWDNDAVLTLLSESIHCSSSARRVLHLETGGVNSANSMSGKNEHIFLFGVKICIKVV